MGQVDKNSVSYLKKMSDNRLLKEGYYKISRSDSIFFWIRNKTIEEYLDYSNCKNSTIKKAKQDLEDVLEIIGYIFFVSGENPLYKYKYFLSPKNLMNELGESEHPLIENNVYNLFIEDWFGVVTADYLKFDSEFSIKLLDLESRGKYVKIECNNDYLPSDFNAKKHIISVIKSRNLIPLLLWLPMSDSGAEIKSDSINNCIKNLLNYENSLLYKKTFFTFADTLCIICLSYNKYIPEKGQLTLNKPLLELFFSAFDENNTVIISNGNGYAAYSLENIESLKKLIRKLYVNVN